MLLDPVGLLKVNIDAVPDPVRSWEEKNRKMQLRVRRLTTARKGELDKRRLLTPRKQSVRAPAHLCALWVGIVNMMMRSVAIPTRKSNAVAVYLQH